MKKWILTTLLVGYTATTFAATTPSNSPSLVGQYKCKGFDPVYQHHYTGTLIINPNPHSPQTYLLTETFNDLDFQKNVGIGYVYHHNFVSIFQDPSYGVGMTIYAVDTDGNLTDGKFLYYAHTNKGIGKESCVKNLSQTANSGIKKW